MKVGLNKMWVVKWKSKYSGYVGTNALMSLKLADAWLKDLKAKWWKDFDHWLEMV